MSNEIAVVKQHWLELASKLEDLPAPFQQEIFLLDCPIAGTSYIRGIKAPRM